jgi:hypothetical protein
MTPERNCLKCRHCLIDAGHRDYSEYTPGEDPQMTCLKKHWDLPAHDYGRKDVREAFESAKTCGDYEEDA